MKKLYITFKNTGIVETIEDYFNSMVNNVLEAIDCFFPEYDSETEERTEIQKYIELFCDEDADAVSCDENGNLVDWEEIDKAETEYGWHSAGDFYEVWDSLRAAYISKAISEYYASK